MVYPKYSKANSTKANFVRGAIWQSENNRSNNARDQLAKNLVNFLRLFLLCLSAIVGIICSLLECSLNTKYLVSKPYFHHQQWLNLLFIGAMDF